MGRSDNPFLVIGDTRPSWVVERPDIVEGRPEGVVKGVSRSLRGQFVGLPKPYGCCAESPAGAEELTGAIAGAGEN